MIRALNELVIRGPRTDILSFLERLEASLTDAWQRDRGLEERLRATGVGGDTTICFRCADSPKHKAAALWLQARAQGEWYVSNIVPLSRNGGHSGPARSLC